MRLFEDRARAFEAEFAHDEEMQFRAAVHRDHLLGMWAAGLLGKQGDEAVRYAHDLVRADLARAGDEDLVAKLVADLDGQLDGQLDAAAIREQIASTMDAAKRHLLEEGDARA